jgi:predicted transcriptional regulator
MFKDINELNDTLYGLLEKGFVEIAGINENGELTYRLTDLGKGFAENYEE